MDKIHFVKVKTSKQVGEATKKVTETIMLRASSLTDLESQIFKYADENPQFRGLGSVEIVGVTFTKVVDIYNIIESKEHLLDTKWYKVLANWDEQISEDKVMKRTDIYMIESDSVKNAEAEIVQHLKSSVLDYSIGGVTATQIAFYLDCSKPMKVKESLVATGDNGTNDDIDGKEEAPLFGE